MDKAMTTWTSFGKEDKSSWKFKLYAWGERVADRVEFEETCLKAINTSFKPGAEKPEFNLEVKAQFVHPALFKDALDAYKAHLQEREPYHKRYFYLWSLGLPVTAPIGLAPIIPNVPFYFCAWRAWSHWKAWGGATYLNQLLTQDFVEPTIDSTLDSIYETSSSVITTLSNLSVTDSKTDNTTSEKPSPIDTSIPEVEAQMLLRSTDVPAIASSFNLSSATSAELLRALEQSRMRLKKELKQG